ncbi:hypothetical protein HF209_30490 [Pseudomonas sp. WS 5096]|uniref:Uncharacterized protein n=1 Tax=Pseudomonas cremoris TaxID=2724178 RepID=A0ABR6THS6_9PSED|nr:hypothetical protein [Pseudomonas cremoris]MBC2385286.1 hypothetical protein [Pseudomonas cremoris]
MNDITQVLKASASFPEGWADSSEPHASLGVLNECLKGKQIQAVEFTNYNTIRFVLDKGLSVSLTPSGIEGDDLDLLVHAESSIARTSPE